ncbi:MAG: glycoside hydrolase family 3 N-terminal domain-containing protein, partial [Cyanobium sp.]
HLELPLLEHSRERLDAIELPPFRAAIGAGVASVMTAHLLLPNLDPQRPATLSPAVLNDLLRRDLGFSGLVVTDALVMEAISGRYGAGEAALLALEAGADLVLMPADARSAIEAIVTAVADGRLTEERLEASLERRRQALALLPPPSPAGSDAALTPLGPLRNGPMREDQQLALELVQRSLEMHGTASGGRGAGTGLNLIRLDHPLASPFLGAGAPALNRPGAAGFTSRLITPQAPSPWSGDPEAPLDLTRLGEGPVLLQLFVRGNPFRGSAGGGEEPWDAVIQQLQRIRRLAGLAVYGSPYLWRRLQPLLEAGVAGAYSPGQMPLAQEAVLAALGLGDAPTLPHPPDAGWATRPDEAPSGDAKPAFTD